MMHPEGRPELLDVKQAHQRAVHDDSMNPKAPAARLCKRQIKDFEKLRGKEKKELKDLMELKPDTPLILQEKYALGGRIKYQEQKPREEQTPSWHRYDLKEYLGICAKHNGKYGWGK